LVGEEFGEQCECLLGVVAPEVIDLLEDWFVELGEELEEEGVFIVFIGLSEDGFDKKVRY
jgi:hypothetical protein